MGKYTLISISNGLGSSIFCRKVEKARPMKEEMDGQVVFFRQGLHSDLHAVICKRIFR